MYMSSLKKMPRWLTLFPWFVMVCALLFSAGIVVFGLHNAKRESDFTSQLTLEKGAALSSARWKVRCGPVWDITGPMKC